MPFRTRIRYPLARRRFEYRQQPCAGRRPLPPPSLPAGAGARRAQGRPGLRRSRHPRRPIPISGHPPGGARRGRDGGGRTPVTAPHGGRPAGPPPLPGAPRPGGPQPEVTRPRPRLPAAAHVQRPLTRKGNAAAPAPAPRRGLAERLPWQRGLAWRRVSGSGCAQVGAPPPPGCRG